MNTATVGAASAASISVPCTGFVVTPVYDRYLLAPGRRFTGPAVFEERESTTVVPPGATASIDAALNLLVELPTPAAEGSAMTDATVAHRVVAALARRGVRRMFGVPGGGSSLDLIEAGAGLGIEFVLTRTESAALMMAAATAELSGTPGVAITTKGPGTANGTNGFAYAAIDRAPLVLLTDGFTPAETAFVTHQVFDQQALLAPLAKGAARLEGDDAADEFEALLDLAMTPPYGPVLVELTSEAAKRVVPAATARVRDRAGRAPAPSRLDAARSLLAAARRPVIILGLEARDAATAAAVRRLAESLACPVLATYKAMGVMPDAHPQYVGGFTSGAAEYETVSRADLILLVGFDPVELLRQRWRYSAPVVDVAAVRHGVHYLEPARRPVRRARAGTRGARRRCARGRLDVRRDRPAEVRHARRAALRVARPRAQPAAGGRDRRRGGGAAARAAAHRGRRRRAHVLGDGVLALRGALRRPHLQRPRDHGFRAARGHRLGAA